MVLPEIEEEDEDLNQRHSKLSLTSLLLGKITKNVLSSQQFVSCTSQNSVELKAKKQHTPYYIFLIHMYTSVALVRDNLAIGLEIKNWGIQLVGVAFQQFYYHCLACIFTNDLMKLFNDFHLFRLSVLTMDYSLSGRNTL